MPQTMAVLSRARFIATSVAFFAGVALLASRTALAQEEDGEDAYDEYNEEEDMGAAEAEGSQSRYSQQAQPTEEQMRQQQQMQQQMISYIRSKATDECRAELDARVEASQPGEDGQPPKPEDLPEISDDCNEKFTKLAEEFRTILQAQAEGGDPSAGAAGEGEGQVGPAKAGGGWGAVATVVGLAAVLIVGPALYSMA